MRERLKWLGHVPQTKEDRLPKITLFGQPPRANLKIVRLQLGWEDLIKKD